MNFPDAKIQDLETQIDEQKTINLQCQQFIKTITSKNRQLTIENKELKIENKNLIDKVNRVDENVKKEFRTNFQRNLNFDDRRNVGNENLKEKYDNLKDQYDKVFEINQNLVRKINEFKNLKSRSDEYEKKFKQLSKEYDELINHSATQLMNDPRVANKITKNFEIKIKELETLNEQLQEKLDKANDKINFDFNTASNRINIKSERI